MFTSIIKIKISLAIAWIQILSLNCDNNCRIDKIEIPLRISRIILTFECYSGNDHNPTIPIDNGSNQREYNELDLSPNLFIQVPTEQLCPFENIYLLDLSHNMIRNLTKSFGKLSCLKALKKLDLSSNLIDSPLAASDFDQDAAFTSHLEFFSLKYNMIPSIESKLFFKSDGSSAFPKLAYLDLSYNQIKQLDLLWPLSLHQPSLNVMLNYNRITSFTNQLNMSYTQANLLGMTGRRFVNVKHNLMTHFDDKNLLQYGLNSASDLENFFSKLSNFDFRSNRFYCECPLDKHSLVSGWFRQYKNSIARSNQPVYQIFCDNIDRSSIFNFTCSSKMSTTTIFKLTTTTRNQTINNNKSYSILKDLMKTTQSSKVQILNLTTEAKAMKESFSPWWFSFLIILFLVLLLVLCCECRLVLMCVYQQFGINLCSCLRRNELKNKYLTSKIHDATICYSLFDLNWFEENYLPSFCDYIRGYKINKLGLNYSKLTSNSNLCETGVLVDLSHVECMRASKRIILLLTDKFMATVWKCESFRGLLKDLCKIEPECIFLLINVTKSEFIDSEIKKFKETVNMSRSLSGRLAEKLRSLFTLNKVESLDWTDLKFWSKLIYLMPLVGESFSAKKSSTNMSQYSRRKSESPLSIIVDSTKYKLTETDFQLIQKLNKSIENKKEGLSSNQVQAKLEPITGLFEKNRLLFQNEPVVKIHRTLLEEILNGTTQSDVNENSINNGVNLESKIFDVSVISSDLLSNKTESLIPKISKKRKRLKKNKRSTRNANYPVVSS